MSIALGKRKRPTTREKSATTTKTTSTRVKRATQNSDQEQKNGVEPAEEDAQILQDIFRRHFEQRFDPLAAVGPDVGDVATQEKTVGGEIDGVDSEGESEWDGLSDDGEDEAQSLRPAVEVVEHKAVRKGADWGQDKADLKAFMSSRPPTSSTSSTIAKPLGKNSLKSSAADAEEDGTEAMNLKHDIALQRLLSESHLLTSAPSSSDALSHSGKARHKALDLRLQSLGAKKSMFTSQKMPMEKRQGIASHRANVESKRRAEAKENGVILEKERWEKSKGASRMRDRGVGGPGVGRMRGGMLTLSQRDVASIQGSGGGGRGGKGGKKSRGKRNFGI